MRFLIIFILLSTQLFSQNFEKGMNYYSSKNYKKAITELKRVVEVEPKNHLASYYLGMSFLLIEDVDNALDYFTKSIQTNSKYPDAFNSRGLAYGYAGQVEESLNDFDRAIILDPNFAEAYLNRATAHSGLGNNSQAISDFTDAIRLSPQNPSIYYQRGQLYQKQKNFEAAISDFKHSISIGLKRSDVFFELGNCYFISEQWRNAIDNYSEAIRLNPRNDKAINNRALSYDKIGKNAEAKKDRETLEKMAGVKFTPFEKIKWKTFTSTDKAITIQLPNDWYFYEVESSTDRTEIMISPNKWDGKSADILASCNLVMNRNMNALYQVSGSHELVDFWSNSNAKNSEDYLEYFVGSQHIKQIDGLYAKVYRTFRKVDAQSIAYESYEVVAAGEDDLFYGYFQSPDTQWKYYDKIYEKAIKTLKFQ